MTLIELMVFLLLVCAVIFGLKLGLHWGSSHGTWLRLGAGVMGALLGGVGFFAAIFLLASPFLLYGAIKRALEPADLVCRCQPGAPTPEHLKPHTAIEIQAVAESHRLMELPDCVSLQEPAATTEETLRARLAADPDFAERIALAAQLGHPAAHAIGTPTREPILRYEHWAKLPEDLQAVLRSGLPPRLCLVWSLACAERVLPVFEQEFHLDTRARQAFGAALLLLHQASPEALELCRAKTLILWRASEAGCRVWHRDLWTRIWGSRSPGERAVQAIQTLARSAADFVEPRRLWAVYSPGDIAHGYETPAHRCAWSQPCFHAEDIAYQAALATPKPGQEYQWQRTELAHLILGWPRWAEDRAEWQRRVEEEWIPKVLRELKGVRFDVPAYARRIRKEFVPWRT